MSKFNNYKKSMKANKPVVLPPKMAWIPMKTGLWVIAVASLAMGILVAWQAVPYNGLLQGLLYGALFAGMVWGVFLFSQFVFRALRK
jgi:hypothetical protein